MEDLKQSKYEVVTRTAENYAALLLEVQQYWNTEKRSLEVVDSQVVSDRHTKKVYYLAVVRPSRKACSLPDEVTVKPRRRWL